MELVCDGILMNTAIAEATNPVLMASVVKKGVELGREAFIAEHMPHRHYGSASSTIGKTFF
jgi:thiazole synthase|tara:strand:+ start:868 stop:1050 length:183 start_codon:yes stop_codon:yes gene_type:complete